MESGFFAERAALLRFLMGLFGLTGKAKKSKRVSGASFGDEVTPVVPSSLKEWSLIQVPDIRMPLPGSFFKLPVDDIFDWNLTAIGKG
jgi:hypothetical protein